MQIQEDSRGRKSQPVKVRELLPEYDDVFGRDGCVEAATLTGKRRAERARPVRISQACYSGTRNRELSQTKSARKLDTTCVRELLKSPKNNVRRRLDVVYNLPRRSAVESGPCSHEEGRRNGTVDGSSPSAATDTHRDEKPVRKSFLLPPNTIKNRYTCTHRFSSQRRSEKFNEQEERSNVLAILDENGDENSGIAQSHDRADAVAAVATATTKAVNTLDCASISAENRHSSIENVISVNDDKNNENTSTDGPAQNLRRPTVITKLSKPDGKAMDVRSGPPICDSHKVRNHQELHRANSRTIAPKHLDVDSRNTSVSVPRHRPTTVDAAPAELDRKVYVDMESLLLVESNLKFSIRRYEEELDKMRQILAVVENMQRNANEPGANSRRDCKATETVLMLLQERHDPQRFGENGTETLTVRETDAASEARSNAEEVCGEATKENCGSDDDEKENVRASSKLIDPNVTPEEESRPRRRSARLARRQAKPLQDENDDFLSLERELNIMHPKLLPATAPCGTPRGAKTPVSKKKFGFKSERPLREYMRLKSSAKFLQTPDMKRISRTFGQNVISVNSNIISSPCSKRLFAQCHDIFRESPLS